MLETQAEVLTRDDLHNLNRGCGFLRAGGVSEDSQEVLGLGIQALVRATPAARPRTRLCVYATIRCADY